jgi:hypothetical protein
MAAHEHERKNFLNAEAQSTRRSAKEFDLIFSADLCVLCVSALKSTSIK